MPRRRNSLWWGTLTLTGAALASRGLGLIYRMLLARFLGAEGLGFFQMIFPFYIALVTLSVAGTPIAISQMVAEGRAPSSRLLKVALWIVLGISVPLMVIVILGARPLSLTLYHDARFIPLLWALAPALLGVAFTSVLRGYFIGIERTEYPAASQVAEQMARVTILFAILNFIGTKAFANAPLVAVMLIPLGEMVSLIILGFAYFKYPGRSPSKSESRPIRRLAVDILRLSLPITFNRLMGSAIGVLEASLIPERLVLSGMSQKNAIRYFGQLTGMALPLIFFPTALTSSLSINLVPTIAKAHAEGQHGEVHRLIVDSLRATALLTIPVTIILLLTGVQLDDLFFHATISRHVFIPLVVGGFFLYFDITLSGVLRGLGRTDIPMRNDLLSSVIEVGLIFALASRPGYGPEGIAIAVSVGFVISAVLNAWAAFRLTHLAIKWFSVFGRPVLAASPLLFVIPFWKLIALSEQWNHAVTLMSSLILAAVVYLVGLSLTGVKISRLI